MLWFGMCCDPDSEAWWTLLLSPGTKHGLHIRTETWKWVPCLITSFLFKDRWHLMFVKSYPKAASINMVPLCSVTNSINSQNCLPSMEAILWSAQADLTKSWCPKGQSHFPIRNYIPVPCQASDLAITACGAVRGVSSACRCNQNQVLFLQH